MSVTAETGSPGQTILVVDDDPTNLRVVSDFLKDFGFQMLAAQNGESALERARYAQPDLILLDVMMPGIDGFETCRRLKADEALRDIPVIFMTVLTETQNKVQAFRLGAVDYVTKPFQHEEVLARVTTHLRLRELTECLEQQVHERTAELRLAIEEARQLNQQLRREIAERVRAEQALRRAHDELELRVQERTAELTRANQLLQVEIAERARMAQSLLRSERLAAMGDVTAMLAHEIRNPLQAIRSHLELVLDFPLDPEEREHDLRVCWQEVEDLTRITQRMLSLLGIGRERYRPVSIIPLVQRTLALLRKPLQEAAVQVTTDLPADLPPVLAVPDQIGRVLLNLVLNTTEAMPDGGSLHIAAHVEREQLVLNLVNDGPPIPAEHVENIFDPFFTTKTDSAGLGLFISHNIVQRHGGTMNVENLRDGRGVAFTLTLPVDGDAA